MAFQYLSRLFNCCTGAARPPKLPKCLRPIFPQSTIHFLQRRCLRSTGTVTLLKLKPVTRPLQGTFSLNILLCSMSGCFTPIRVHSSDIGVSCVLQLYVFIIVLLHLERQFMILTIFIQFSCVKRLHAHFCVLFAFFACFLYVNSHVCVMNSAGLPEAVFSMLAPGQQQLKRKMRCLSKNALVEYPQEKKSEDLNVKAWRCA